MEKCPSVGFEPLILGLEVDAITTVSQLIPARKFRATGIVGPD